MTKVFIAVIIATIALIIVFQAIDPNNNSVINNPNNTTSVVEGDNLSVSINGEVTRPGTYYVDLNSTSLAILRTLSLIISILVFTL